MVPNPQLILSFTPSLQFPPTRYCLLIGFGTEIGLAAFWFKIYPATQNPAFYPHLQ